MDTADLAIHVEYTDLTRARAELREFWVAAGQAEQASMAVAASAEKTAATYTRHVAPSVRRVGIGVKQLSEAFGGNTFAARSLVWQLNQVAQTGAITGRWIEALAIQIPDILGAFGLLGIAAGAAAALILPLGKAFGLIGKEAVDLDEVIDSLAKSVKDYGAAVESAIAPTSDLQDKFGRYVALGRTLLLRETDRLMREAKGQFVSTIEDVIGEVEGGFSGRNAWRGFRDFFGESDIAAGKLRENVDTIERTLTAIRESDSLPTQLNYLIGIRNLFEDMAQSRRSSHPQIIAGEQKILDLMDKQIAAGLELVAQNERLAGVGQLPLSSNSGIKAEEQLQELIDARKEKDDLYWERFEENAAAAYQRELTRQRDLQAEQERRADFGRKVYQDSRAASDASLASARELLDNLDQQRIIQSDITGSVREIIEGAVARAKAEKENTQALIDGLDISESLKAELQQALNVEIAMAASNIAGPILAAQGAAIGLTVNLGAALAQLRAFGSEMVSQAIQEKALAQARQKYIGDPVGLAGQEAVIRTRGQMDDRALYGAITTGNMGALQQVAEVERQVRSSAEAAKEAEIAADAAEEAFDALLNPTGGGGGGGGGSGLDAALEHHKDLVEEAKRVYDETRTAVERYRMELALLDELLHTINPETQQSYIDADTYKRAVEGLNEELARTNTVAQTVTGGISDMFSSIIRGSDSAAEAVSRLADRFADMLLTSGFNLLQKSLGLDTLIGSLIPSAKGNVFHGGNVVPFAQGGIVSKPTLFPMKNGAAGLMGEAGDEAIVPLRRGKGGQLGIAAQEVDVRVTVSVDKNGNLQTYVDKRSGRSAAAVVAAYDQQLPGRMAAIQRDSKVR